MVYINAKMQKKTTQPHASVVQQRFALLWGEGEGAYDLYKHKNSKKCILITYAIGVAKTAIANRPISNTNWVIRPRVLLDKIRPETRPFIKPLTKKWRALPHEIMMRALFFPLRF